MLSYVTVKTHSTVCFQWKHLIGFFPRQRLNKHLQVLSLGYCKSFAPQSRKYLISYNEALSFILVSCIHHLNHSHGRLPADPLSPWACPFASSFDPPTIRSACSFLSRTSSPLETPGPTLGLSCLSSCLISSRGGVIHCLYIGAVMREDVCTDHRLRDGWDCDYRRRN